MPRWMGWMWVVTLAAVVGLLIPALIDRSGATSLPLALAGMVVLIALGVTGAFEVAGRVRRRGELEGVGFPVDERRPERAVGRRALGRASAQKPIRRLDRPSGGSTDADWDDLKAVATALSPRQVDWLASTSFSTPWLDDTARQVIALRADVASLAMRPFPPTVAAVLADLERAISEFTEFYEHNTFPDPVLLGTDWRFFEWDDPRAFGEPARSNDLTGGRAEQLQRLAARCARTYEQLGTSARAEGQTASRAGSKTR